MTPLAVELDRRKRQVLAATVKRHVTTAEPVGSQAIAGMLSFRVSSATIRNDLATLERTGYLQHPHTSSGRVPTDLGYRFYVNELMRPLSPGPRARHLVVKVYRSQTEFDPALQATCRLLTSLTHYPALASGPSWHDNTLRRIELTRVDRRHVLAIVVTRSGQIRHSLLAMASAPLSAKLHQIAELLSSELGGRPLGGLSREVIREALRLLPGSTSLREQATELAARSLGEGQRTQAFVEGTALIFAQREFRHPERAQPLLELLQDQAQVNQLVRSDQSATGAPQRSQAVVVRIGSENEVAALSECALVFAPYRVAGRTTGSVGIVGPRRLAYDQAVATVQWVARRLGEALTRISH